ncbi:MAG: ribbon-helix-helix protein, CopG family [Acidobacteria bacterium]|nr:ribbon-helix-helix protein, CopG family [Acidobacteriota bacterium]MYF14811.1 ribbon-helix-helix protein, CopG family [Acidobacteriota bacterium]MYI96170.1 ribbon-helix-helix protein, CopG family [Acidobacteriota bacterium]
MFGQESPMPGIRVHVPEPLLDSLDRLAREQGKSRSRLIVESCRRLTEEQPRRPDGFFSNDHLSAEELRVLQEDCQDFEQAIRAARRSRNDPPF